MIVRWIGNPEDMSAPLEEIVRKAEEEHVKASILERNADIDRNPVYTATAKRKANLFV